MLNCGGRKNINHNPAGRVVTKINYKTGTAGAAEVLPGNCSLFACFITCLVGLSGCLSRSTRNRMPHRLLRGFGLQIKLANPLFRRYPRKYGVWPAARCHPFFSAAAIHEAKQPPGHEVQDVNPPNRAFRYFALRPKFRSIKSAVFRMISSKEGSNGPPACFQPCEAFLTMMVSTGAWTASARSFM